ncbi:NUDIX domain-containing protein [Dysosmobacter sp. HCP28S3_G4]|uniref:NUDIX domain-containing protein n=1 Tax=Dysosmobacter sp. HCP28S3_G4 TaxID=3438938 RepID=UPI003F89B73B
MNEPMELTETFVSREDKYKGRFLDVHVDQITLPNGKPAVREVADHCPGVAILALDDRNNVLTVSQYRYVFSRVLMEIPAGKLEPGEDPAAGALRELKEETGAVPDQFIPMGHILPAPGCYGEVLYLFLARGLQMGETQPDEDEFLIQERIPFDEMVHRCLNGEIEDAKTVAAVLKAKLLLDL